MLRWLIAISLALAGCTTPCDQLDTRARDCRFAPSRYADERTSTCTVLRQELTPTSFDRFADCVSGAECSDQEAVDRCATEHVDPADACVHYRLWAAACSLEPTGVDEECAALRDGMSDAVFEAWVACITADGCPRGDDPRYDRCQDVLFPPSAGQLIDACLLITAWTEECADQAPEFFPVTETDLVGCISLAEPFTSDSFLAYGQCLATIECDDVPGRLECLLQLELLDPSGAVASCERLVSYANTCGTTLGGGSVQACSRLFARFSTESLDAYVSCIEARSCDDTAAPVECAGLLQLQ